VAATKSAHRPMFSGSVGLCSSWPIEFGSPEPPRPDRRERSQRPRTTGQTIDPLSNWAKEWPRYMSIGLD
jgi:hypothetical protein